MGLGALFRKISGTEEKGGDAFCFVFGSDKRFVRRNLELQGSHIQDNKNRLAYFSASEGIGTFTRRVNGTTRTMGPVSLAYELITELYNFSGFYWINDRLNKQMGGNGQHGFETDEVLDNGWAEGFALAHQRQNDEELKGRLSHILLLTVLGAFFMFLIIGAATGLISNLFSGISRVFG